MKRAALPTLVQGPWQVQLMLLAPQQLAVPAQLTRVHLSAQLVPPLRVRQVQAPRQVYLLPGGGVPTTRAEAGGAARWPTA